MLKRSSVACLNFSFSGVFRGGQVYLLEWTFVFSVLCVLPFSSRADFAFLSSILQFCCGYGIYTYWHGKRISTRQPRANCGKQQRMWATHTETRKIYYRTSGGIKSLILVPELTKSVLDSSSESMSDLIFYLYFNSSQLGFCHLQPKESWLLPLSAALLSESDKTVYRVLWKPKALSQLLTVINCEIQFLSLKEK